MTLEIDSIIPRSADTADKAAFASAEAALRFAFGNSARGQPDSLARHQRRTMARDTRFDDQEERAAWAGDIRRRISSLGHDELAMLMLRYCPRTFPCACRRPCCSGASRNAEWDEALAYLVERSTEAIEGKSAQRMLRAGIVRRWAGSDKKVNIGILADLSGVHRDTAGKYAKAIRAWLERLQRRALDAADMALRD